jgi:GNAT superfamily N-acetyltransferase
MIAPDMESRGAPESPPLTVRAMRPTPGDLEAFRSCLEANGLPRSPEQVRWQFVENPVGTLLVDFAVDARPEGETIAAIYAVVPFAARVDSRECVAAQSLDTLTDARYRGRGLFVTLAKATYARLAKDGVAFVYGFPNENSVHGFFERLEWRSLDPLPWCIRPLRLGYLLRRLRIPGRVAALLDGTRLPLPRVRLPQGCSIREVFDFDPTFDALWERFAAGTRVALRRDAAYLRWRLRRPGARYRVWALDGASGLLGFVATSLVSSGRVTAGYVMELIHEPGARELGVALLAHALLQLVQAGAEVALACNFRHSPNHPAFRRAGFLPLPWRMRAEKVYFGVRPFAAAQSDALLDRRSWYLSCCDFDTQ